MMVQERLGEEGWPSGVVPSTDSTLLPETAAPSGRNSALGLSTAGHPFVQKRRGLALENATPLSGSPAVIGIYGFYKSNGTVYDLIIGDDGSVNTMGDDGTISVIAAPGTLTTGAAYPIFETAADLAFLVNGHETKKFNGSALQNFGITRPTVGSLAGAAGAGGSPNGTYELRVTYFNDSTGNESSASDTAAATVSVTNQKISVTNVPVSSDSQVTRRYLYIRNTATMGQFYRAGTIADNSSTTVTLDFVDANLTVVGPTTTSNNPPPVGVKYIAYHLGRMFVADDVNVYYSNIGFPEQFPPENVVEININDGQGFRGLLSDHEILMIFKEDNLWGIFNGSDPSTWDVLRIDKDYGCIAPRTIVSANGWTWWWSRHGVVRWAGAGAVDPIGAKLYGDPSDRVNLAAIAVATACRDGLQSRYLVALPGVGQTRSTMILPFNTLIGVLESDEWDPMDCSCIALLVDSDVPTVHLGNYKGQVFHFWSSNNDGLPSGSTWQGTFVATAASMSTITDAGATFTNTGGKLIERKVTVKDQNGQIVSPISPRLHITDNTGTVLTLSGSLGNLVIGATYTYEIAGPDFSWDTPWRTISLPWTKKRFEYLWVLTKSATFGTSALVDIDFDYDPSNSNAKRRTFQTVGGQGVWDTAVWDKDIWDTPGSQTTRFRVARVGRAWKLKIRNSVPNQPFAFLGVAVQADTQTVKN